MICNQRNRDRDRTLLSGMMTSERKIWEAAILLVRRHGESAITVADREVTRYHRDRDELTCAVWCWISRATQELLRPEPEDNERIH
jgi:hypothetical protein